MQKVHIIIKESFTLIDLHSKQQPIWIMKLDVLEKKNIMADEHNHRQALCNFWLK